ncbi:AsmA-like C-terminal region-containing protein [Telluribacter sp. SYSU D00476]|uniref:AsmA-like C-terminal region-containing protein n=1 Tax=Telluribacter sp. SYSU D00476 TaxID=2811430 RepID=UPI001FF4EC67|nr:AsmA-like C-terminal region-containing protein [Telluribacter sp. SYSU D00476]
MFSKVVKGFVVVALSILLLMGGMSVWAWQNQERVFEQIKEYINDNIDGQLEARKFTFAPLRSGVGFTFSLHDVTLNDTLYVSHKTHLLQAQRLNITLDLREFMSSRVKVKSLAIEDGTAIIFKQKNGYSNLSVLTPRRTNKKKNNSHAATEFFGGINKLSFQNFTLHYSDTLNQKYLAGTLREVISHVGYRDSTWSGQVEGGIYFEGLTFHPKKGSFLKKQETTLQLEFAYHQTNKQLIVRPSELQIASGHPIQLSGQVDLVQKPGKIKAEFTTDTIALPTALKLLPGYIEKMVTRVKILPVVKAKVQLEGNLGTGMPKVHIAYESGTFDYNLPIGKLRKMTAVGTFTNQANPALPAGDANSQITGTRVRGYFESIPLEGSIVVKDFKNIKTVIESSLTADPASLNSLLDPGRYQVKSGSISVGFRYQGNLLSYYDKTTNRPTGKLAGKIVMDNVAFSYLPQNVNLSKIKGTISIDEDELQSKDLRFYDGKNTYFVSGNAVDLLTQVMGAPITPKANLHVKVPDWQLTWLDFFLKKKTPDQARVNPNFRLSQVLDKVIDQTEVVATLESNKAQYKRFTANKIRGKMTLTDTKVSLDNISMNAFGGSLKLSGYIDNIGPAGSSVLHAQGKLTNTDVQSVFYSLENFGQKAITDQNIQGKLDADFVFDSNLMDNASLRPESMSGKLDIALIGAEVKQFEPFIKIKNLLFKSRDFDHVKFAPIRKQFVLKGQEIEIPEMEIESNVLTLFVNGIYSFGKKTDLSIQLPLQNLKKRGADYQLAEHSMEYMKGMNIFLRAVDEGGEVNIKYDPFKRLRKGKEEKPQIAEEGR